MVKVSSERVFDTVEKSTAVWKDKLKQELPTLLVGRKSNTQQTAMSAYQPIQWTSVAHQVILLTPCGRCFRWTGELHRRNKPGISD